MSEKVNPIISPLSQVWFIQNTTTEGPGYLGDLLKRWKIPVRICNLELGDALPEVADQDAVIVLGGPMSANDRTKTMQALLKWIRSLLRRDIPYLGICLGLQTLVKAAGGTVLKSPVKEVGLKMNDQFPYTCELTLEGKRDPLFRRFTKIFPIFQLHGETVGLTSDMTLLAKGQWCHNQVVRAGKRAYGIQGHLEVTTPLLTEWLQTDPDLKHYRPDFLIKEWLKEEKEMHYYCRKILLNFLKIADIVG